MPKKRKSHSSSVKRVIKFPKTGDIISGEGAPPDKNRVDPLISFISSKVEDNIKAHIFPMRFLMDRRYREHENLQANVIALQSLLRDKEIVTEDEFNKEYEKVMNDVYGYVDETGSMVGYTQIEIYNLKKFTEDMSI